MSQTNLPILSVLHQLSERIREQCNFLARRLLLPLHGPPRA